MKLTKKIKPKIPRRLKKALTMSKDKYEALKV